MLIQKSSTTTVTPFPKGGQRGINLYIARINRLARKRQIQDAIYNGLACVVTSYLSMLFAYWLFSFPALYLGFANISEIFPTC